MDCTAIISLRCAPVVFLTRGIKNSLLKALCTALFTKHYHLRQHLVHKQVCIQLLQYMAEL